MNVIWGRFLRSAYRSDPISSFVVTVGVVDAAIGGLSAHWSLLSFGLGTVGTAIALRWWQQQRQRSIAQSRVPVPLLPSHTSQPRLPRLSSRHTPDR